MPGLLLCSRNWKFYAQVRGNQQFHGIQFTEIRVYSCESTALIHCGWNVDNRRPHPSFSFAPQIICIRRQFRINMQSSYEFKRSVIHLRFEWIIGKILGLLSRFFVIETLIQSGRIFSKKIWSFAVFHRFRALEQEKFAGWRPSEVGRLAKRGIVRLLRKL